jgi:DNA-binding response OmpR family regulator
VDERDLVLVSNVWRVAVIEDNDDLRSVLSAVIEGSGYIVGAVDSVESLPEIGFQPDIYLVDLNLPGADGLSLVEQVRMSNPNAGVIIISARERATDIESGYSAGADMYLTKPIPPATLLAALGSICRRLRPSEADAECVLDTQAQMLRGAAGSVAVSAYEQELIRLLALSPGRKLETWQIAEVFGMNLDADIKKALEVRVVRLRRKMREACGTDGGVCIKAVRGFGYQLISDIKIV